MSYQVDSLDSNLISHALLLGAEIRFIEGRGDKKAQNGARQQVGIHQCYFPTYRGEGGGILFMPNKRKSCLLILQHLFFILITISSFVYLCPFAVNK
jgi:hypothetical protein